MPTAGADGRHILVGKCQTEAVGSLATLDAVTKRYSWRGPWVLSGVDLVARPGTLTAIVGANGSGKSTLLRIAAGLVSPSGGTARVPAHVAYLPERQPARLKFSAAEYLANMGHIKGLATRAVAQRGAELFERLGLQPNADVPWETLSKGNRQKVLLAQAFLAPTALAVLDEPYSGLDDAAREALDELIAESLDQEAAVILSAHRTEDLRDADETRQLVSGTLVEFRPGARRCDVGGGREQAHHPDDIPRWVVSTTRRVHRDRSLPSGRGGAEAGPHGGARARRRCAQGGPGHGVVGGVREPGARRGALT